MLSFMGGIFSDQSADTLNLLQSVVQSSQHALCWMDGGKMRRQGKKTKDTSYFLTMGESCTLPSVYFMIHLHNEIHYFCYMVDLVLFF